MAYNYTTLSAAIQSWSERTYTQAEIGEFIMLAEAEINTQLGGYQRQVETSITTDGDGIAALPDGFRGLGTVEDSTGDRYGYRITGENIVVTDGESTTLTLTYYSSLTPLSESNPTNWLIEEQPGIYLAFCEHYQRLHEEDWQSAAFCQAKGKQLLSGFLMQNAVTQFGRAGLQLAVAP